MPAIGRFSIRLRFDSLPSSSSRQRVEPLDRLWLQPAVGQLLNAVCQPMLQKAPVIGRRLAVEKIAPLLLEISHRDFFQVRQLRQYRVGHAFSLGVAGVA